MRAIILAVSAAVLRGVASAASSDGLMGPLALDPALDCGMRALAFNFSATLLPLQLSTQSVFDALRLGAECGMTWSEGRAKQAQLDFAATATMPAAASAAATYFSDPVAGNDANPGTRSQPFRTVHRAILAARSGPAPATIYLRNGTFYLAQEGGPLLLTAADSGLTIASYPGERATLSGALPISGLTWSPFNITETLTGPLAGVTDVDSCAAAPGESSTLCSWNGTTPDAPTCAANCAANSTCTAYTWHDAGQGVYANACLFRIDGVWTGELQSGHYSGQKIDMNVWQASLAGKVPGLALPFDTLLYGSTNRRAVRGRFPNGNPETMFSPAGFTNAASWLPPRPPANGPTDVAIPSPSRPADLWFPTFQLGQGGTVSAFSPPESFWGSTNPPAGNQYVVPSGVVYGGFSDNVGRWSHPERGIVHAFHGGLWGDWAFQIDSVNASGNTITFGAGGWQEARGSGSGSGFYVENLLEEVDTAGEWYVDADSQTLYLAFNASDTPPASSLTFLATQLENLVSVVGDQDAPVTGLSLINLTFAHTSTTFMRPYEVPSGGDWSFHRGGMVVLEGTVGAAVAGCTFWSPGGNGLLLSRYNLNASITASEFAYCGESAIVSAGTTQMIDGTGGDQPTNTYIGHNIMREVGLYTKQSGGYYHATSRGVTLDSNVMFNLPRAGININDGFAGGHTITNNLIFNSVRETSDHGCFNSWDRQPYSWDAGNYSKLYPAPSVITHNYFINNYHSTWPIDHDDGSNAYTASDNLLIWGGFKNYLGFNKHAVNNLYVYPDASVSMRKVVGGKNYRAASSTGTAAVAAGAQDSSSSSRLGGGGWPYCAMSQGTSSTPPWMWDSWTNNTCVMSSGAGNMYDWDGCNPAGPYDGHIPVLQGNTLMSADGSYSFACGGTTWTTLAQAQAAGVEAGTVFVPSAPSTAELLNMAAAKLGMPAP